MKQILALIFIFTFASAIAQNNNIISADITYKYIEDSRYTVRLKLYIECSPTPLNVGKLRVSSGSDVFEIDSTQIQIISVKDMTPVLANCGDAGGCNGTFDYAWQEYILEANLNLTGYADCNWRISWESCCRNADITTGHAGENFYTFCELNKCVANSSPEFMNPPLYIANQSPFFNFGLQLLEYNLAAIEPDGEHDSLVYSFGTAMQSEIDTCTYATPYEGKRFIKFPAFPNENAFGGLQVQAMGGDLFFFPTEIGQVATGVIEVTEWKKVNGQMVIVGKTRRDMLFRVLLTDKNKTPEINERSYRYSICANQPFELNVSTTDPDELTGTSLKFYHNIPGFSITIDTQSGRYASARFNWTPADSQKSTIPYTVTVEVTDSNCSPYYRSSRNYLFFVDEDWNVPKYYAGNDTFMVFDTFYYAKGQVSGNPFIPFTWSSNSYWPGGLNGPEKKDSRYGFVKPDIEERCTLELYLGPFNPSNCSFKDTVRVFRLENIVYAGPDQIAHERDTVFLQGVSALNRAQFGRWRSLGDGYFVDSTQNNAKYLPGNTDNATCKTTLVFRSYRPHECAVNEDTVEISLKTPEPLITYSGHSEFLDTIWLKFDVKRIPDFEISSSGNGSVSVDTINNTVIYLLGAGDTILPTIWFKVISRGCTSESDSVEISPKQLLNISPGTGIIHRVRVYPNPSAGIFEVEFDENFGPEKFAVYDLFGKIIWQSNAPASNPIQTINLNNASPGTYILMIEGPVPVKILLLKL